MAQIVRRNAERKLIKVITSYNLAGIHLTFINRRTIRVGFITMTRIQASKIASVIASS